jgi:hypothetical protein
MLISNRRLFIRAKTFSKEQVAILADVYARSLKRQCVVFDEFHYVSALLLKLRAYARISTCVNSCTTANNE